MNFRRLLFVAASLTLLFLLAACSRDDAGGPNPGDAGPKSETAEGQAIAGDNATETPTAGPTATPSVTPTPTITPTPTRIPTGPVTICMAEEPQSLYLYGPDSYAARVIRELIYDGPIDTRDYAFQPVILEKIPSLADGDARLESVTVEEGDWVVDNEGNVVHLRDGVVVRPAGCYTDECAVTFVVEEEGATTQNQEGVTIVSGSVTMEQLVVEFKLLPGLTWSDGEALTASDSVFSYELAKEAHLPPRLRTGKQGVVPSRRVDPVERTAAYEATGEQTVRWTSVPGFLDPYYQGNFFVPLPEHLLGELSVEELLRAEESAKLPVGWGPYVLTEWEPGEQIVAERNPNYFRTGEDLPYFDQVIFRFAGDEPERLLQELQDGTCDIVTQDALHTDYGQYETLEEQGDLIFHSTPSTVWEHLDFGINPIPQYDWRGDIFEDPRVRQAAAHCIDRQALADELTAGRSVVPNAFVPPDHPILAQAELADYAYDPQRAIALLQEAGWRDTNGDGISESYGVQGLADGTTLIFDFVTTTSDFRRRIAEMVVEDLAQCGFQARLSEQSVPPETFFSPSLYSPIFGRSFDMTSFAWLSDALPPCHLYLTSEIPGVNNGWSGFNVSGYSNEAYDTACATAQGTLPGMDTYVASQVEALQLFNQDLPAIPLLMHLQAALSSPNLTGLELDATQPVETWNVENFRRSEE